MRRFLGAVLLLGLIAVVGCGDGDSATLKAANQTLQTENDTLRARMQRLQDLVAAQDRAAQSKEPAPATQTSSSNPVIEIRKLEVYNSDGAARIDARVTNTSSVFVSYWYITADIYNSQGEYLGNAFSLGADLRPGSSQTNLWSFSNVNANEIATWKPAISQLRVRGRDWEEEDGASFFDLKVIE